MEDLPQDPPVSVAPVDSERLSQIEQTLNLVVAQLARLSPAAPLHPVPQSPVAPVAPVVTAPPATPAITVRNRRYAEVLSVDTYRLRDRSDGLRPDQVATLTSLANQVRPRLDGCLFSGDPSIAVLPFLVQLVRVANQSHLSEATLLWIVDDFLRSPAKEAFRSNSFNSWPSAVLWLLTTYAPESALEVAVRRLQTTEQAPSETVRQFGLRLQVEAAALGNLLSVPEVKSMFTQGIRDPVRSLFAASQPVAEFEETTPLSVLIGRAELLEAGSRPSVDVRSPPRLFPPSPRSKVLVIPEPEAEGQEDDSAELLALEVQNRTAPSARWTCFVCYNMGHGWLECPLLKHVPVKEKEEIVIRRRKYIDSVRPPSPRRIPSWPTSVLSRKTYPEERDLQPVSPDLSKNESAPPRL
jgi:hypothetical protein